MWNDKQKTKNQIRIGEMHGDIVQGSTIVDNSVHYTVLQDPADAICELKGDPAALEVYEEYGWIFGEESCTVSILWSWYTGV